jgi:DNA-binding MarR family transcriptional regulator
MLLQMPSQAARAAPLPTSEPRPVEARYRDNLPRHLIGVARHLQSRVMRALVDELGYSGLRLSFGPFTTLIREHGRSLSAIATELGISKQAASQLANALERSGYIERRSSPDDRRSKVAVLTSAGTALVDAGDRLIFALDAEYAKRVGEPAYRRFTRALGELHAGLGLPSGAAPAAGETRSAGVLPLVTERVQRELMDATISRGHPGLKMSHGQVLPLIGPDGGRIREMARVQQVSRQAISAISQELEELGYLRRAPDPADGRGVVLELTAAGRGLIADSVAAADALESSFQDILGGDAFASLRDVARDLYDAFHLEEKIFEAGPTDIEQLARRLRQELCSGDAARLAELLKPRSRRRTK